MTEVKMEYNKTDKKYIDRINSIIKEHKLCIAEYYKNMEKAKEKPEVITPKMVGVITGSIMLFMDKMPDDLKATVIEQIIGQNSHILMPRAIKGMEEMMGKEPADKSYIG